MCSNVTHRTLNSWLYYLVYTTFWFIINCNTYFRLTPFFCIHISQGSVATCLKRGGIFKHKFVANLLLSRLVKKILKIGLVKLWPRVWCIVFLTHGVCWHVMPKPYEVQSSSEFYTSVEKRNISATVWPVWTKFGVMMQNVCLKCAAHWKCYF